MAASLAPPGSLFELPVLHHARAMWKRRKRILFVSVLAVLGLGLTLMLLPRNEPKYQGRYLSEWMAAIVYSNLTSFDLTEAEQAVKNIGTNAVPFFVDWFSYEIPQRNLSLHDMLPRWIGDKQTVWFHLRGKFFIRAGLGQGGICILGTNAASAIPKLTSILQNRPNDARRGRAIRVLAEIGKPALPVLQAVFADTNQANRVEILCGLHLLSLRGQTNECVPILKAALEDQDIRVRSKATNLLQVTSVEQLFSIPWD